MQVPTEDGDLRFEPVPNASQEWSGFFEPLWLRDGSGLGASGFRTQFLVGVAVLQVSHEPPLLGETHPDNQALSCRKAPEASTSMPGWQAPLQPRCTGKHGYSTRSPNLILITSGA